MRTLKLTHQEIEILEKALAFAYNQQLETVRNMSVINSANKYDTLRSKINSSEADV
jgi:hypothetical protein